MTAASDNQSESATYNQPAGGSGNLMQSDEVDSPEPKFTTQSSRKYCCIQTSHCGAASWWANQMPLQKRQGAKVRMCLLGWQEE